MEQAKQNGSRNEKLNVLRKILLFVLIIVFFVSIIFIYYLMVYSTTRKNIIESGRNNAHEAADQINMELSSSFDVLKVAAYRIENMLMAGVDNSEILDYIVNETVAVHDVLMSDTTGIYGYINGIYMDGLEWVPDEDYDPVTRPWYLKGLEGRGEIMVADPYLDLYSGEIMITIVKMLGDGKSVVALDVSANRLQKTTEDHVEQSNSYAEGIISKRGQIITHSDKAVIGTDYHNAPNPLANLIGERMSISREPYFYLEYENRDYLAYVMPLLINDWLSVCVIDATDDFNKLRMPLFATISIAVVFVGVLAYFMIRSDKKAREARELAVKSQIATAASEAKSTFLSNMSHEIRTPINAILGMNEMVIREAPDASILSYSENIKAAGGTLLGIINDILDFSKIEAGKIEIIPVEYEISTMLGDLVNMVSARAEEKRLKLILQFDPQIPRKLCGDEMRIKQVITNILTNAVKYTEKGRITFRIDCEKIPGESGVSQVTGVSEVTGVTEATGNADSVVLKVSVSDTGIGIKEEDLNKLFSEFERIEEKRNRNIEGTGLGMSITESLLDLMGSSLQVKSTYGKGSEFSFSLTQKIVDPEPMGDYRTDRKNAGGERKVYREKFTAPDAVVLVVDDNLMNLKVFESLVKKTKVQCDTAESGDQCVEMAKKKKYDIIFLDHMMPGKDGIETLHELLDLENSPNSDTPMICQTANAISGAREQYIAEGFEDYITKPIDPDVLEDMLAQYLPGEKIMPAEPETEKESGSEQIDPRFGKMLSILRGITQVNVESGIGFSGSETEYFRILQIFYGTVDDKTEEVNRLQEDNNLKDYTIKIHALKSSCRIIGAKQLGEEAQLLENAGKQGDISYIKEHHRHFVRNCLHLKELLNKVFNIPDETQAGKPEADALLMANTYQEIREAAEDMDCDRLSMIFREMEEFTIPGPDRELFARLKLTSDIFEYDRILMLLDENRK